MKPYLLCPTCGSDDIVKNGLTRRAKQNYKCRDCGRQFVEDPQWRVILPDSTALIERLLLEKLPLAGIARVMQVSQDWLQHYVNSYYSTVPQQVQVLPKAKQSLQVQMDELWSFVDDKGNEQWVWRLLIPPLARLWIVPLAIVLGKERLRSGNRCRGCIGNVPCSTLTTGSPTRWHCPASGTGLLVRRQG